MHTIVNDDRQGMERTSALWLHVHTTVTLYSSVEQDRLFFVVYERVKVVGAGMGPHLWTYRSRITLEHLNLILQRKNFKEKHPILYEFLQQVCVCASACVLYIMLNIIPISQEHNLRATQYLPGIVRLQQRLFDRFNHKLDRKEAKSLTIREFLQNINTGNNEANILC